MSGSRTCRWCEEEEKRSHGGSSVSEAVNQKLPLLSFTFLCGLAVTLQVCPENTEWSRHREEVLMNGGLWRQEKPCTLSVPDVFGAGSEQMASQEHDKGII
ncbi:unnamed protein product [Pleuronectes platessa]|uniref:Uncharacterized protein n=1 Tax=Pleuronectes platessa TaxID=8262 RepID=A0A9N7UYL6_PLEPL|nr:unnamed protein product [Pleuronectes platessa]